MLYRTALLILLLLIVPTGTAQAQLEFRSDDPIWIDDDRLPIPPPARKRLSQLYDFVENTFGEPSREGSDIPAASNVNTVGEVPDSSWFTNRMGRRVLSIDELVRGPNQGNGPDQSDRWTIVAVKTEGVTPGFTIRDARGEVYFIKFDPPRHPQLATSTGVIATKFFYAFGYNVPENYLALIRREELEISSDARLEDEEGKERPVRKRDINHIFDRAFQLPDGTTPVVASKRIAGRPLGPFKYRGTRRDDANDIFEHQDRRELRGLRVFAAWLNHDDSRSINTLDMYVGKAPEGYVKHYLIDFGSCFGSGSIKVQSRRAGNEYILEGKPIVKAGLTLGWWDRPWRRVHYPDYPAIGRFEADYFQPEQWRPEYPNPAFDRMQPQDAFWATRIVARFTEPMIRALVQTGQIADPRAADYLVETLVKRQQKIVKYYLGQLNPLDEFRVTTNPTGLPTLVFRNLGIEHNLASNATYHYRWFRFDNASGTARPLGEAGTTNRPELSLPSDGGDYLKLEVATSSPGQPRWQTPIVTYLRRSPASAMTVVGVGR